LANNRTASEEDPPRVNRYWCSATPSQNNESEYVIVRTFSRIRTLGHKI